MCVFRGFALFHVEPWRMILTSMLPYLMNFRRFTVLHSVHESVSQVNAEAINSGWHRVLYSLAPLPGNISSATIVTAFVT